MIKAQNLLSQIFSQKKKNLLSIYFTAGYPSLQDTHLIIKNLSKAGVDFIEIGSPYNDPIADGITIQDSANQAIINGMNVGRLFSQLFDLKKETEKNKQTKEKIAPLVWMGYFNLILNFGLENFCKKANQAGISGLIVPDLPVEYFSQYQEIFKKYQLSFIFMISPSSSKNRILEIDQKSDAFIYVTSGQSITGQNSQINQDFLKQLLSYKLKNPLMIGFNIKDSQSYQTACEYGSGAIIGSAFIQYLKNNPIDSIDNFIQKIRG